MYVHNYSTYTCMYSMYNYMCRSPLGNLKCQCRGQRGQSTPCGCQCLAGGGCWGPLVPLPGGTGRHIYSTVHVYTYMLYTE